MLLISNMYPSDQNPTYGIFIKNFETQMKKEGFSIDKCVIKGRGKNILEKMKKYMAFFQQTLHSIHRKDYDLIYVHYMNHSLLPLLWVNTFNRPLVLNAHGSDVSPQSTIGKLFQRFTIPVIRKADRIVVPSEYFKSVVEKKFSLNEEKIFVSPSGGVNTKLFSHKMYTPGAKMTIGYISRIDKNKGWHTFLLALKLLKEKTTYDFDSIIIGDGPEMELLKTSIERYDLSQNILILGAIEHNVLPIHYHKIDLFIFPTLSESLGLVGLEALSCGIPVLGSDIPALREYIYPNTNGDLFEAGNPEDLFVKIENFINLDVEKKKKLSTEARKTALKYDADIVAHSLSTYLTQLILEPKQNA